MKFHKKQQHENNFYNKKYVKGLLKRKHKKNTVNKLLQ